MFQVLLFVGLVTRLLLIPLSGFKADIAFWKGWGLAAADRGIQWMIMNTNYNYPPGFAYILWLINKAYALFKNPYQIGDYWNSTNIFYLFLIKSLTIVADLFIVFLIIKIGQIIFKNKSEIRLAPQCPKDEVKNPNIPKMLALFYFLNPAVIYDGAVWGQVDQIGLVFFLTSIYFLMKNRVVISTIFFTLSYLFKFQSIIFIPLFYVFVFRKFSFSEAVKSAGVALCVFLLTTAPFVIHHQMDSVIRLLTINFDWFPWYSLNAFNMWWLASGSNGMGLTDKHLVFGILSAKQVGFYLFTFVYFIGTVAVFFSKKEALMENFLKSCGLAVFGFFMLLTQSHERYLFPLVGLLPLMWMYESYGSNKANRSDGGNKNLLFFSTFYLLLSMFFFLNMYLSMGWNYPDQVIPAFNRQSTIGLSVVISYAQIFLFFVFLFWFFSKEVIRHIKFIGLTGMSMLLIIFFKHVPYLSGKPVSLLNLKPVGYHQDYLEPAANKTVESVRGVNFWNRLSVNYFFYKKGIGSHADSEITYHLNGKFSRFSTDFGIDTEGAESANVSFSILGDGKELFKSEGRGRFDSPGSAQVNIKGMKFLTLKITRSGESNFGAHADWLNPSLIR